MHGRFEKMDTADLGHHGTSAATGLYDVPRPAGVTVGLLRGRRPAGHAGATNLKFYRFVVCSLETKIRDALSALVRHHVRAFRPLEGGLGGVIAERRSLFVVGLGGTRILWPTAAALCEGAHALQRAGMVLCRRLLEQRAGRSIV